MIVRGLPEDGAHEVAKLKLHLLLAGEHLD